MRLKCGTDGVDETKKEIEPCPFCGGRPRFVVTSTEGGRALAQINYRFVCGNCGAVTSGYLGRVLVGVNVDGELYIGADDREKTIVAWNRRAKKEAGE